ncbi:MAG: choline dehydrogenase [Pseudomonadaceae bacterium]|nr:choline dehydrogenase [Pseudomonadaceae bacterium]
MINSVPGARATKNKVKTGPRGSIEADFVIVGAGSAGCVLANRLSADTGSDVIVVEAGGTDAGPFIQMPAALSYPMNMKRYDWGYQTEPEPNLEGRRLAAPRGKVLGGSSSINGLVYVRGHRKDFDGWAELGARGWDFDSVLPYFKRLEDAKFGDPMWRGHAGPMRVTRPGQNKALDRAFMAAIEQAGFQPLDDYNAAEQEGFGALQQTIHQGRRWSTANAYLRDALKRDSVTLLRGLALNVIWRGDHAAGVRVHSAGRAVEVTARRRLIIAASAFNSPKILLQSGVGPAADLNRLGIAVVADRPGVGANLQDHLEVYVQSRCKQPVSLYSHMKWPAKALAGARWLLNRSGVGASNHFESGGFVRSSQSLSHPDIQFHFLPAAIRYDGSSPSAGHGYQLHVGPMRSKSRGSVRLASADPFEAPKIQFNYLSADEDWREFRHCIRLARDILSQPAFAEFSGGEIAPGPGVTSDTALDDFVRQEVESAYHPCGTCRMGSARDPEAVVDEHCRVIGVSGLSVVDSSIFPRITNGNLNAPTMMVAEKAADHLLAAAS